MLDVQNNSSYEEMCLKHHICVWMIRSAETPWEQKAILGLINSLSSLKEKIEKEKNADWHLLCNVLVGGREIDAVLITANLFVSIELKHVPERAAVYATQNQWLKIYPGGDEEPFEKSPFEQAKVQRGNLCKFVKDNYKDDRRKIGTYALVVITPAVLTVSGLYDNFENAKDQNVKICRLANVEKCLSEFLLKSTSYVFSPDKIETVIRRKFGMALAKWVDGCPVPENVSELPQKHNEEIDANVVQALNQKGLENKKLKSELDNIQKQLRDEKKAHSLTKGDLSAKKVLLNDIKTKLKFNETQIQALKSTSYVSQEEIEDLRTENEGLRRQQDFLQRECEKKTSEVQCKEESIRFLSAKCASMETKFGALQKEKDVYHAELRTTKEDAERSHAQNLKLKQELTEKEKMLHEEKLKINQYIVPPTIEAPNGGSLISLNRNTFVSGFMASGLWDKLYGRRDDSALYSWAEALSSFVVESMYCTFDFEDLYAISKPQDDIFVVLSNLVSRGTPTLLSIALEKRLAECCGLLHFAGGEGELRFQAVDFDIEAKIYECVMAMQGAGFDITQCPLWKEKRDYYQLFYQPLLTARIQKVFLEAFRIGYLPCEGQTVRVLAIEHDITGVTWALKDLEEMLSHAFAMISDNTYKAPHFEVDTIALHPARSGFYDDISLIEYDGAKSRNDYDVIVDIAFFKRSDKFESFDLKDEFAAKLDFKFSSYAEDFVENRLLTGGNIKYKPMGRRLHDERFEVDVEAVAHLRYFLQLLFRKNDFRPGQVPILNRALQSQPTIGLLPTGGGKSLTYQLAALLQPGICLIVDPLKSLMYDQISNLKVLGIDVCTELNSDVKHLEVKCRIEQLTKGMVKFLFVAPERLQIPGFRAALSAIYASHKYFSYGVIDEVHCVSEWGHDFRTSYLHLGRNLYRYVKMKDGAPLPLLGLTATASFDVLADVERVLSGEGTYQLGAEALVRYENTNRLELQYLIEEVKNAGLENDWAAWDVKVTKASSKQSLTRWTQFLEGLRETKTREMVYNRFLERENIKENTERYTEVLSHDIALSNSKIIREKDEKGEYPSSVLFFCPTTTERYPSGVGYFRNKLREEWKKVPQEDIESFASKGSTGEGNREKQKRFKENQILFMAATKAFGMGLDKPNIRVVTNLCYPQSLEDFVQLAGRAGRDGKMALCVTLYSQNEDIDYDQNLYFYNEAFKGCDSETVASAYLLNKGKHFEEYVGEEKRSVKLSEVAKRKNASTIYLKLDKFKKSGSNSSGDSWEDNDGEIQDLWKKYDKKYPPVEDDSRGKKRCRINESLVKKVIYRLCLIGVVDDVQEDYANNRLILSIAGKEDGRYYKYSRAFLGRYYLAKDADALIEEWKKHCPENTSELMNCVGKMTDFVYEKIAEKRKRAIDDVQDFCKSGLDPNVKSPYERNEALKDYLYYYFNSKYARSGYRNERNKPFSLYDDTEGAKRSDLSILWKYMGVIDPENVGASESPKDNIKHLQGAVRLLRRAVTGANPTLALLDVFCTLLTANSLEKELRSRLLASLLEDGFSRIFLEKSSEESLEIIGTFFEKLAQLNVLRTGSVLNNIKTLVYAEYVHHFWKTRFEDEYASHIPFKSLR